MGLVIQDVLRVSRSKAQAKASYDKMSRYYDYISGFFEQKYRDLALKRLNVQRGEIVMEMGFGTGHCLKQIAVSIGEEGKVFGIDISAGMLDVSRRRLSRTGLLNRVELVCGDALKMPYEENKFDAVFSSFNLELFDTPEIPQVLAEIMRVLKPKGRFGVISMSKGNEDSPLQKLYEWLHKKIPQYVDCRPIYVEKSIADAGFEIQFTERVNIFGLSGEIIICTKPNCSRT